MLLDGTALAEFDGAGLLESRSLRTGDANLLSAMATTGWPLGMMGRGARPLDTDWVTFCGRAWPRADLVLTVAAP